MLNLGEDESERLENKSVSDQSFSSGKCMPMAKEKDNRFETNYRYFE